MTLNTSPRWPSTTSKTKISQPFHGQHSQLTSSPIEHVWSHLKRKLEEYERKSEGILELWERVQVEWEKIGPEVCQKLIESMPRRVAAVLKAKGGHTKY